MPKEDTVESFKLPYFIFKHAYISLSRIPPPPPPLLSQTKYKEQQPHPRQAHNYLATIFLMYSFINFAISKTMLVSKIMPPTWSIIILYLFATGAPKLSTAS